MRNITRITKKFAAIDIGDKMIQQRWLGDCCANVVRDRVFKESRTVWFIFGYLIGYISFMTGYIYGIQSIV